MRHVRGAVFVPMLRQRVYQSPIHTLGCVLFQFASFAALQLTCPGPIFSLPYPLRRHLVAYHDFFSLRNRWIKSKAVTTTVLVSYVIGWPVEFYNINFTYRPPTRSGSLLSRHQPSPFHQTDVAHFLIMPSTTEPNPGPEEANLHVLSFSSLLNGDKSELANLLSACEDHGFFYLDLRDWESRRMLQQLEATWRIMKQWFDQPLGEKLKTETISDAHG